MTWQQDSEWERQPRGEGVGKGRGFPNQMKEAARELYKAGIASRLVAQTFNVDQKTILNWVHEIGFYRSQAEAQSGRNNVNYGKHLKPEHRQRIANAQKGRPLALAHRAKLSAAKKGRPLPTNTILGSRAYHKGRPLTLEHRRKIGDANRGENSFNWKGGTTTEADRIRNSMEFKEWRQAVFQRDSYNCQGCGKHGGQLEAHHLDSFAKYPELRFDVRNGITYCPDCHKRYDKWRN